MGLEEAEEEGEEAGRYRGLDLFTTGDPVVFPPHPGVALFVLADFHYELSPAPRLWSPRLVFIGLHILGNPHLTMGGGSGVWAQGCHSGRGFLTWPT